MLLEAAPLPGRPGPEGAAPLPLPPASGDLPLGPAPLSGAGLQRTSASVLRAVPGQAESLGGVLLNVGELGWARGVGGGVGGLKPPPTHTHCSEAQNQLPTEPRGPPDAGWWGPSLSPPGGPCLGKQTVSGSPHGLQPELLGALVLCAWGWVSLCVEGRPHGSRTLTTKRGAHPSWGRGGKGDGGQQEREAPSQACLAPLGSLAARS